MKKIVVIEDDFDVTDVLKQLFKENGYIGMFFNDSRKAIIEIENILPDLIITDLMMPNFDGFQVCSYLKSNPKTKRIPVIVITGYDSSENRKKIFNINVDDYLSKPFDLKDMLKKIESLTGI